MNGMKKNLDENRQLLQVDPVSGEYYVVIPECMVNEFSWYEDTEIILKVDGDELILHENKD
jgi:hypothetical protein